jgi:hypothetical protein
VKNSLWHRHNFASTDLFPFMGGSNIQCDTRSSAGVRVLVWPKAPLKLVRQGLAGALSKLF